MKTKILNLFLLLVTSMGTMFAEKVQIGDLYYNLDATNQTAEVTYRSYTNRKYNEDWGITTANIPASVTYNSVSYSVTSIGDGAFRSCSGLTSVTIPNSVTSIGGYAFYGCSGLTSATIPNSVTSIGNFAFAECTSLTSIEIPNSVTSIGDYAFNYCRGLTSVTIPESVTSIGDVAFAFCRGLTSVTIPNSVTSIGNFAFKYCDGLTSPVYNAHVFAYMPTSYSGAYTIPDGIESIAGGAFDMCSGLTSVTIPNSVTSIGNDAFCYCAGLTSVTIPNSVTSIGWGAFRYCRGLISVTIPSSVTSIGESAFSGCSGLTSVTIPNSVTSIGYDAFSGCTGLTSVTNFANTPQEITSSVFDKVDKSTCVLYVPAGSVSAYQSADVWKDFTNILPIGAQPADVTTTTVTPSETTADIAWPQVTGAATYTIEIKKKGELICTLIFNAQGQLISIALAAPSRNNAPQRAQAAGFSFTVTSLDSGTTYSYTMTAKGNNGNVLKTESGTFTTTGESQGIEEISSSLQGGDRGRLILHNGQIFILRGDNTYTLQGQEVK